MAALVLAASAGPAAPARAGAHDDRRAAALLARAGSLEAVERFPARRLAARAALARMGRRAVPFLVSRLDTRRTHESLEAGDALVAVGRPALPAIRSAYPGLSPHGRRVALGLMTRLPDPANLPLLRAALADPGIRVRGAAAAALGGIHDAPTLALLAAELEIELRLVPHRPIALRAVLGAMLAIRGATPAVAAPAALDGLLLAATAGPGLGVRRLAAAVLAAGGPASRECLCGDFAGAAPAAIRARLRAWASRAARSGDPAGPEVREGLAGLLGHPDPGVRGAAAAALAPLDPARVAGRLKIEDDRGVRRNLVAALARKGFP